MTIVLVTMAAGCATTRTPSSFSPQSVNEVRFRDRSQSKFDDEVRVTVAVPSADENKALFGAKLFLREIQPIWLKVENHSDRTYYLISAATDPNYFSPNETAYAVHGGLSRSDQKKMANHFSLENAMKQLKNSDDIKNIVLLHLSDSNSNAEEFKGEVQKLTGKPVYIADKGLKINLGRIEF